MRFSELIAQRFPKFKKKIIEIESEENTLRTLYFYRKEFGLSYEELMNEPLPSFMVFIDQINKENEREKKEMDKSKYKR